MRGTLSSFAATLARYLSLRQTGVIRDVAPTAIPLLRPCSCRLLPESRSCCVGVVEQRRLLTTPSCFPRFDVPRRRGSVTAAFVMGPTTRSRINQHVKRKSDAAMVQEDEVSPAEGGESAVRKATTKTQRRTRASRLKKDRPPPDASDGPDGGLVTSPPSPSTRGIVVPSSPLLFSLHDDARVGEDGDCDNLVMATLVGRPSTRNKSPYVADVFVPSLNRTAICHVPNLDMGGKCRPGVTLLMRRATDNKGRIVGPDAVSPKYGTPKCEFILQLLWVDESTLGSTEMYPPVWVGAHPSLGERIAKAWIDRNLFPTPPTNGDTPSKAAIAHVQSQVTIPEVPNRRFDFMITYEDGTRRIVEVKTVVDCDYSSEAPPPADIIKCRYFSNSDNGDYHRTAIFPWGTRKQKGGKDGKTLVVSSRAIHHVDELARLVSLKSYQATLLFVVVRSDAEAFRPNVDACPEFVHSLRRAHHLGVQVVAKRVRFGEIRDAIANDANGDDILHPEKCYSDIDLPIQWPENLEDGGG